MISEDTELLRRYARDGDEEAFGELVRRYLDMVWGTARRITRDDEAARDVAQTVFTDLARKAGRLPGSIILSGWLYRAAGLAAHKVIRTNTRRAQRELHAMELHSNSEDDGAPETLLPLLDEALAELSEPDRNTVVLRFFGHKALAEIGQVLGVSEDAAQKRLARALEKLRSFFQKRGATVSIGALGAALTCAGAQAAPAGLAGVIAVSSLSAAGAAATVTWPFLATLKAQAIAMKTQLTIAAIAAGAVATPLVVQNTAIYRLRAELASLEKQVEPLPALREEQRRLDQLQSAAEELEQLKSEHLELIRLRQQASRFHEADFQAKRALRQKLDAARSTLQSAQERKALIQAEVDAEKLRVETVNNLKQLGLAARIFKADNQDRLPKTFDEMQQYIRGLEPRLDRFEFVQHGRPVGVSEPEMIVFREKEPRRLPNGRWSKAYTMMDGSVQVRESDTPDFSAWEDEHIAHNPERPHSIE